MADTRPGWRIGICHLYCNRYRVGKESAMTIEQMKKRKKELGYSNRQIAELTGVPFGTVQKIFSGQTESPRYETLLSLEALLDDSVRRGGGGVLREAAPQYNAGDGYYTAGGAVRRLKGPYTIKDWEALPEDVRAELMDGQIYFMAQPMIVHEDIASALTVDFFNFIRTNHGKCHVYTGNAAVWLFKDKHNMLVPDVCVVCDQDKLGRKWVNGAPDLVVEILSPSNRKYDMVDKLEKYEAAGVREYWIVDPENRKVYVYNFEDEKLLYLYTFDDKVPVRIWDGKLTIDFKQISGYIAYQYDEDGKLRDDEDQWPEDPKRQ